jgi:hypothetical protein
MPNPPFAAPNVLNYFIGKGKVYTKEIGANDSTYVHMGNVPKFVITPKPEVKKHYSSQTGTKTLDFVAIVSKEAEVEISTEELNADNFMIGVLGVQQSDGSIELLAAKSVERTVQLRGTNDFGAKVELTLLRVFFDVNKGISLIGDDWGEVPITGQVLRLGDPETGSFGNLKFL